MTIEEAIAELEHRRTLAQIAYKAERNPNRQWFMHGEISDLFDQIDVLEKAQRILAEMKGEE